ncbi:hypothetical protein [Spiroplasma endosymbiont of Polydrusus pterygomalis]|uniref:hypothetical protein n=1 Tax=Spiroplasma endosymbiont of Polydrusus pterygomalis TaxID=3139327 RepID=UPI003CCAB33D
MINFLVEQISGDPWSNVFSFVIGCFMDIFDLIMAIKLPLTNVSLFYILVFTMIVELSIYAVNGTATNYNDLGSTVKSGVSKVYSSTVRKGMGAGKKAYQNSNKQQAKKEVKRQNVRAQGKIKSGIR